MNIYGESAKETYSFLTIDTKFLASDPLRFRKTCFNLIKMTVTDHLKILDDKIKANQSQYDLSREEAKISALSSKNLLDKYEYLTGENLGYKPNVFEKAKFGYSPLCMVLTNNTKSKANKNKAYNKNKQDKYLVYNSQHSFVKFKVIDEFNELSLDSMYKRLNDFKKIFNRLKTVNPQTHTNELLKQKVLDDIGDLFNELYYIYKDKYSEEKDGLNARYKKNFNYKKLRLTDDYQYEPEEEKQQTSKKEPPKKPDKKEPPKKPSKVDLRKSNEWINKKEAGINSELFQKYFKLQKPSNTLKVLYTTNNKRRKTVI